MRARVSLVRVTVRVRFDPYSVLLCLHWSLEGPVMLTKDDGGSVQVGHDGAGGQEVHPPVNHQVVRAAVNVARMVHGHVLVAVLEGHAKTRPCDDLLVFNACDAWSAPLPPHLRSLRRLHRRRLLLHPPPPPHHRHRDSLHPVPGAGRWKTAPRCRPVWLH